MPCLAKYWRLDKTSKKQHLFCIYWSLSCDDKLSATLLVVAGNVIIFRTASSWVLLFWWVSHFLHACFQFEYPLSMKAISALEAHCSLLCWTAVIHETKDSVIHLIVMQPWPFVKPGSLEGSFYSHLKKQQQVWA